MEKGKKGNYEGALRAANEFYEAYKHIKKKAGEMENFLYWDPIAINLAFSCEIYLKALRMLENDGKFITGHDLKQLFDILEEKTKNEIEKDYQELCCEEPKVKNRYKDIEIFLKENNLVFVKWRYTFEEKQETIHFNVVELDVFNRALYKILSEKVKEGIEGHS